MWALGSYQRLKFRLKISWKLFTAVLLPLVLIPLIFIEDKTTHDDTVTKETKYKTFYTIIIMATYWAFEIIPLPVTALIPLVLFPVLGVQSAYAVSQNYAKESTFILIGGVIVALAVEYCGLHNRLALGVMNIVGSSPTQLLLGIMIVTGVLSMWISATSCVAILVPVVCAIIDEIHVSPEILSTEEVRRKSIAASVTSGPTVGSIIGDDDNVDHHHHPRRTSSSGRYEDGGKRRNTTVFGNTGLASPSHHGHHTDHTNETNSFSHHPIYPIMESQGNHNLLNVPGNQPISIIVDNTGNLAPTPSKRNHEDRASVCFVIDKPMDEESEDNLSRRGATFQDEIEISNQIKKSDQIKKMFLFGMAYAANLGGTSVITGTSPNKVFKEVIKIKEIDISQGGKHLNMTFFTWMALNVPPMLVNIAIAWVYLSVNYYGIPNIKNLPIVRKLFYKKRADPESDQEEIMHEWKSKEVRLFLKREYQKLGPMSFHEVSVSAIFLMVILLWIFRDPEVFNGWGGLTPDSKTGDSTGAIFGVILLFIFPKDLSFLHGNDRDKCKYEPLLSWTFVTTKMPWGVVLLLGSGFAIADASLQSGLTRWIGEELELLGNLQKHWILLIVIVLTTLLTEVVSNIACANILLPVVVTVSKTLGIHPLYLSVPVALTCQYAFLFPIATPSNTIVFAAGNFTTMEMVRTGLFLNLICIAVLYTNTITYGNWLFNYDEYLYPPNGIF